MQGTFASTKSKHMKRLTIISAILFLLGLGNLFAQEEVQKQTITGQVVDLDSEIPLIGATVKVVGSDPLIGGITDLDGYFRLEGVPVGRQTIEISYLGYKTST